MLVKKTILSSLVLVCASLPLLAQAAPDLIVTNKTNEDSTTSIPSPLSPVKCSSGLPDGIGVTQAGHTNIIHNFLLASACIPNLSNCVTDIFMNGNCQGAPFATVTFNVTNGGLVGQPVYHDTRYKITGTGYNITIEYNKAVTAKS